jgi:7-cyano-7-deazaguanine synthase
MGIVTLVSGGLDSTLMSLLFRDSGVELKPLFVNYGQRAVVKEREACFRVHKALKLPRPKIVDLHGYGKLISSGLTDKKRDVNLDAFLPGRNALFLLVGASYAFSVGCNTVAIGLLSEKEHLFPDQTQKFLETMELTIMEFLGQRVLIVAPLMAFSKAEVLALARNHGVTGTYSCHFGHEKPCGKCISCLEIVQSTQRKEG